MSSLAEVERHGGEFADADGKPGTALEVLHRAGIEWVRLRLWHTPVNSKDVMEGDRLVSPRGAPVGGGSNDLATTLRLARRAKTQRMKVLLDIHYSDFWTDPGQQNKPAEWANLHGTALQSAVHDYTEDVLRKMHAVGCDPDMVQLGNEINGGMLWPDGKTWQAVPGEEIGGKPAFAALLREAIRAVRGTDQLRGARLPVVLHLANGGDNALFRDLFDFFTAEHLDFDVIGISYYPYYHGTVAALRANLADLAQRYRKPLLVVETAYGYTLENGDRSSNIFNEELAVKAGYPATVEGQTRALREVTDAVASVPLGLGVFYWEPAWLPVEGTGWRTGDGNSWDNQLLFDFKGRALPSLEAFGHMKPQPSSLPVSTTPLSPASKH